MMIVHSYVSLPEGTLLVIQKNLLEQPTFRLIIFLIKTSIYLGDLPAMFDDTGGLWRICPDHGGCPSIGWTFSKTTIVSISSKAVVKVTISSFISSKCQYFIQQYPTCFYQIPSGKLTQTLKITNLQWKLVFQPQVMAGVYEKLQWQGLCKITPPFFIIFPWDHQSKSWALQGASHLVSGL